jgi:hypothetical protein
MQNSPRVSPEKGWSPSELSIIPDHHSPGNVKEKAQISGETNAGRHNFSGRCAAWPSAARRTTVENCLMAANWYANEEEYIMSR